MLLDKQMSIADIKRFFIQLHLDLRHYGSYAIRSANAELHVEVANSFLNWMWWLIEPICMMMIYTLIFGVVFNASEKYFPIFIFIGLTMWSFFRRGIDSSVTIIRSNRAIITKVYIPKYILYLSRLFVYGFKMLVSFGVVLIMMILFRVQITMYVLVFVPVVLILFMLTFGIGTIFMHYGVYVNDLGYITGIVLTMLMYMTGVFYNVAKRIPQPYGILLEKCNPIAFLISTMRNVLLYGEKPEWLGLLFWGLVAVVVSLAGVVTIYHNENAYVKVI